MTNDITGLIGLVSALTALVTAIGTLILHLRSRRVQSQATAKQPTPNITFHASAENSPRHSPRQPRRARKSRGL